jgi:hypothetical protein
VVQLNQQSKVHRPGEISFGRRSNLSRRRMPDPVGRKKYVDESKNDEIERLKEEKRQREQVEEENRKKDSAS